jgi:hypothetical protein
MANGTDIANPWCPGDSLGAIKLPIETNELRDNHDLKFSEVSRLPSVDLPIS